MPLADDIKAEAEELASVYPRGAAPADLAGYFGEPLPAVERALAQLEKSGVALPFLKRETPKDAAAVALGQKGGKARAASMTAEERAEIARGAARRRWDHLPEHREPSHEECTARLKDALPRLAEAFPNGILVSHIAQQLNITQYRARIAVNGALRDGWAKAIYIMGGEPQEHKPRAILFKGMVELPPGLSGRQEKVLSWIRANMRPGQQMPLNKAKITKDVGLKGMIDDVLWALEKKGYVARITPWNREGLKTSPVYEMLEPPEPLEPKIEAPPDLPEEPRKTNNGNTMAKRMRMARDQIFGTEEMVEVLENRRQYLREELDKVDKLLEHYRQLWKNLR